ncbi:MAG: sigma 54-interacting transcriptional regulator [Bdellovibrionales bacterium]|nr:sigma 54-interacting transcriptional regulator [Bdellovibrionales bacterium]
MKTVGIGHLGTTLDASRKTGNRWRKWRPTVAACWQDDLKFDRYEIIYQRPFKHVLDRVVEDIQDISPDTEIVLHHIPMKDPWDFEEVFAKLHEFADGYKFDLKNEDYLFNITTGTHVAQICMFLLAESRYFPGKLLQQWVNPATKDPTERSRGHYSIIDLDLQKYDPLAARFVKEKQQSQKLLKAGIDTRNSDFNDLIDRIETVAIRSEEPMLIMGRTGAGKTELARRIYQLKELKRQVKGRFVEVNCATLKGDAVMSTLFGHKKGAFTGALKDRAGLLKEADKGLIFLDEIGELGPDEQAMLLRAIEDKSFMPLGSDQETKSDFQLIAGTNRDLKLEVSRGEFREDLLARINLWSFRIPDLKDRKEDIEPNIEYELAKFSRKTGKKVRFTQEAYKMFLKFALEPTSSWTGNFRDLNASIIRMGTMAESGRIPKEIVEFEISSLKERWHHSKEDKLSLAEKWLGSRVSEFDLFDLAQLNQVLSVCEHSSSLSEAGRALFAASRLRKKSSNDTDRLKKYLEKFGLDPKSLINQ